MHQRIFYTGAPRCGPVVIMVDTGNHTDLTMPDIEQIVSNLLSGLVIIETNARMRAVFVINPDIDIGDEGTDAPYNKDDDYEEDI